MLDDPNVPIGFCAGGSNDGLSCTGFADCPSGVCRPVSGLIINTAVFPLTAFLAGSVDIACSAVDPNTGKAACQCVLQDLSPFLLSGIGFICISPSDPNNPCDLGEIDCDGGNGLDVDLMSDHNIGACSGNPDCDSQCVTHCAGLGKPVFDASCGGFCERSAVCCDVEQLHRRREFPGALYHLTARSHARPRYLSRPDGSTCLSRPTWTRNRSARLAVFCLLLHG